jgi:para-nitrobenzyl esterase
MRDLPADRIMALGATVPRRPIAIDGQVVSDAPAATFASGAQNDVPLMLGFTQDEAFRSLGPVGSVADYDRAVRAAFPQQADAILKAYPARTADEARRAARDVERDSTVGLQMADWAGGQAATGKAPVFAYLFTRTHPYRPGVSFADHDPATVGAYHTADVPYWLGTLDSLNLFRTTRDWTPRDRALSADMMERILTFAKTGAPGGDWPAWTPGQPRVRVLGLEGGVRAWPHYRALPLFRNAAPPATAQRPRIRD